MTDPVKLKDMQASNDQWVREHPILQKPWYHSIEVAKDLITPGHDFDNLALTRELLNGVAVAGQKCLDLGAMDCLISLLLARRGAKSVTAYDRQNHHHKAEFLRQVFKLHFDYLAGISLSELRHALRPLQISPFDVVVFSGVLYHMFDPLAGLALARGLTRNGGLLLVETSVVVDDRPAAYFNADGRFYFGTNYWQLSVECLDYLLRFLRLAPLDMVYLKHHVDSRSKLQICRIGVLCRATDHVLPCTDDSWMGKPTDERKWDYEEFLTWDELASSEPSLEYSSAGRNLVMRGDTGTVDLFKTMQATAEWKVTDPSRQLQLRLGATY